MRDAIRGYLNAASGLTELSRKRAQELAQSLLASSGAAASGSSVAQQVGALAEELLAAARANREAVREMIRDDVEIAVSRLGLVPASELAAASVAGRATGVVRGEASIEGRLVRVLDLSRLAEDA